MKTILTDLKCPICDTEYEIYADYTEHPNSMYSIRSCDHINLARYSDENSIYHDLTVTISEILELCK